MQPPSVSILPEASRRSPRRRRALLWAALVLLLVVAQSLLVALTIAYEGSRSQDEIDAIGSEAALELRRNLQASMQTLQVLSWASDEGAWRQEAIALMSSRRDVLRIERRDAAMQVTAAVDTPLRQHLFNQMPRTELSVDTEAACRAARHQAAPLFSRSYFVPMTGGLGLEVLDLCLPVQNAGHVDGYLVGTFGLTSLLDGLLTPQRVRRVEFSLVEGDGARLARGGGPRGAGVYQVERAVDVPGTLLRLRADSAAGRPSLIPNLATALVLGLSIALFSLVIVLARDVRRRASTERALAESLAFRNAMENSLITGLRARDMQGAITYVNPAFCAMVGYTAEELQQAVPPYWPPEEVDAYQQRQAMRQAAVPGAAPSELREEFETVFTRKNGERFPVMIYEAPLVDGAGRQTGWMSSVLDVSAQRRVEEISRHQLDRLQATARLATVGEMASLLSHELNQPLAAIASYASGSQNLLDAPDAQTPGLLRQAMDRIAEQAERAGRIIKSVHSFVRRREQQRETIAVDLLIEAVMPLVRLQARKSGTRIELDLPAKPPRVVCDRTMLEQVLLNLTRNGIQAMEHDTALEQRVLTLRVRQTNPGWVTFHVVDAGPGIAPEIAGQLFTPFFTTRREGMGLGLSLCRTVIEQHGGALDFGARDTAAASGTEFRFTLPAPRTAESGAVTAPLHEHAR